MSTGNAYRRLEESLESRGELLRRGDVALISIAAGFLSGYAELFFVLVGAWRGTLDGGVFRHHLLWGTPLAGLIVFVLLGLVIIALPVRSVRSIRPMVLGFGVLVIVGLIRFAAPGVHGLAALALASGIASILARSFASRRRKLLKFARVASLVGGLGLAGTLGHAFLWTPTAERLARGRTSEPVADEQVDVLLIILDTVRARSLGLYDTLGTPTPELERLAAGAVLFETAVSPSSWTLPAHGSMFTGRWPHELSGDWHRPLDDTYPTLAEALAGARYATGGFVANTFFGTSYYGLARGFHHYEAGPITLPWLVAGTWWSRWLGRQAWRAGWRARPLNYTASEVTDRFLRWSATIDDRPYFAFLNFYDAHQPYYWPDRNVEGPPQYWFEEDGHAYTGEELGELGDAYGRAIAHLDRTLGELFEELRRRGTLERTLVIVTSDHGEEFGEHGDRLVKHGYSLYTPGVHIPLIVSLPGVFPEGARVSRPVTTRDLPATVLETLGLESRRAFPGGTLLRHVEPGVPEQESAILSAVNPDRWRSGPDYSYMPFSRGPMRSIVSEGMHLIRNGDGTEELYDLAVDPWEQHDLRDDPARRPVLERLRRRLTEALADPAPTP